jgi:hypothetical protein
MGVIFKSIEGDTKDIAAGALEGFRGGIRGNVLDPKASSYDEARTIWNATIDRKPALIVQCKEASDVLRCVQFARDNGLLIAVKGGGHHIAGNAICDEGIVIDLSLMRAVWAGPPTAPTGGRPANIASGGRTGRNARRRRRRDGAQRTRRPGRHQFDDRHRRPHARRRFRLDHAEIRLDGR